MSRGLRIALAAVAIAGVAAVSPVHAQKKGELHLVIGTGYGKAIAFAFLCHVLFAVLTIFANGFWMLYLGSVIGALAAGTVEAVINPLIATIYSKEKTKWLNILHAGWPGGLVITGVVVIFMSGSADDPESGVHWKWQIALILIPTVIYGVMMFSSRFPVSERVAARQLARASSANDCMSSCGKTSASEG